MKDLSKIIGHLIIVSRLLNGEVMAGDEVQFEDIDQLLDEAAEMNTSTAKYDQATINEILKRIANIPILKSTSFEGIAILNCVSLIKEMRNE